MIVRRRDGGVVGGYQADLHAARPAPIREIDAIARAAASLGELQNNSIQFYVDGRNEEPARAAATAKGDTVLGGQIVLRRRSRPPSRSLDVLGVVGPAGSDEVRRRSPRDERRFRFVAARPRTRI